MAGNVGSRAFQNARFERKHRKQAERLLSTATAEYHARRPAEARALRALVLGLLPDDAGAINTAIGLDDWVAEDDDGYIAVVLKHAAEPTRLAQLRAELTTRGASSAAGNVENVYAQGRRGLLATLATLLRQHRLSVAVGSRHMQRTSRGC